VRGSHARTRARTTCARRKRRANEIAVVVLVDHERRDAVARRKLLSPPPQLVNATRRDAPRRAETRSAVPGRGVEMIIRDDVGPSVLTPSTDPVSSQHSRSPFLASADRRLASRRRRVPSRLSLSFSADPKRIPRQAKATGAREDGRRDVDVVVIRGSSRASSRGNPRERERFYGCRYF